MSEPPQVPLDRDAPRADSFHVFLNRNTGSLLLQLMREGETLGAVLLSSEQAKALAARLLTLVTH